MMQKLPSAAVVIGALRVKEAKTMDMKLDKCHFQNTISLFFGNIYVVVVTHWNCLIA